MRVAILAGGKGSRMRVHGSATPKALCRIGGEPIILHVMRRYAMFGHDEFVVALGHRGAVVGRYLAERFGRVAKSRGPRGRGERHGWRVTLVDTGEDTATGGRIRRLAPHLGDGPFMLTWCDGLADVDLDALAAFHRSKRGLVTLTAVRPPSRFGVLTLAGERVTRFREKPAETRAWINGAYFVVERGALDYIADDGTRWEQDCLAPMAREGRLMAYRHEGFWQCMDTPDEHALLERAWASGNTPWLDSPRDAA